METEETLCNICHTDFEPNDDLVKLKCGHVFHYECIYITYKNNIDKSKYNKKIRICPYCRNYGGYLELKKNVIPIKDIHKEYNEFIHHIIHDNKEKYIHFLDQSKCLAILKTGKNQGQQCGLNPSNETTFCKRHKKVY